MSGTSMVERDCVIAGGGPAGMLLGLLLARHGLRVSVLEKHADFFRDFRGDTIHPSTLTVLGELGLRDAFLRLPVHRADRLDVVVNGHRLSPVDFALLGPPDDFLVLAPQWDLLNFIAQASADLPNYELRMSTNATGLVIEDDLVVGLTAVGPTGDVEFRAPLTIAADGRHSTLRAAAGLTPIEWGVPIDVLWFDLPVPDGPVPETLFSLDANGFALTIPRGDHWQGGYVIPKGGFEALRAQGLDEFHRRFAATAPFTASVISAVNDWDKVKLLSVQIDHLPRWHRPGFVAIGDAAHAMSPVGGVGVNYAIQDAVALANAIAGPLRDGAALDAPIAAFQARRERPVRSMQRIQRFIHDRMGRAARRHRSPVPPAALGLIRGLLPLLRPRFTRLVGLGLLPEHVSVGFEKPTPRQ
ncbi:MAG TPA: FAD-dependent oxidoreductase [Microbacteriaceae bacterium]|nr:FAD-dependent oxidoreductase [Microbacteriaceae bacterium]